MPDQRSVHDIANAYADERARLDPLEATQAGITDYDALTTDLSPEGFEERVELTKRTLRDLETATAHDEQERVAAEAMRERLGLEVEMHDAGLDRSLNVITSPAHWVREAFDLMPTESDEQWGNILSRLAAVPQALDECQRTLRADISSGHLPKARQVTGVIDQVERVAADFFTGLVADAPGMLKADLHSAASAASEAYAGFGRFLSEEVAPTASEHDASGRDVYRLASRYFLGADVDLDETYEWGIGELARIEEEMAEIAQRIVPGGSVADAFKALDADPDRTIHGTNNLQAWMQELADHTVDALSGTHFDIPEPVRRIDCKIAPTQEGGIYYTGPSEDFARPGTMWWSVPESQNRFSTWQETTTVFHEGVPGHHLQVAQVIYRRELLNRWQRLYCWVSGHGEGWALYAERLMAELGFLDDPGDRLGMLDAQALRAARVVVDIGVHLGKDVPSQYVAADGIAAGVWDYDAAWTFLRNHVSTPEGVLRFELDRYLGWPGQAPSYKIGERIWLAARDEARQRNGDAFDLKDFHRAALDLGALGLDPLRDALARL